MNIHAKRIHSLRYLMMQSNIHVYMVLTSDPHLSEYLPKFYQSRQWLSGFSGSSGTLVVTKDYAGLWTDGRYWIQADKELQGSTIDLQRQDSTNNVIKWLCENIDQNQTLATDFKVLSLSMQLDLKKALKDKNISVLHKDLITTLWIDREPLCHNKIYEHIHCVRDRQENLAQLREKMRRINADYHILASLDDIAWLCNLRGSDITYNPVFMCFFLLSMQKAILFVKLDSISIELQAKLKKDGIDTRDYEDVDSVLNDISSCSILLDSNKISAHLGNIIEQNNHIIDDNNPSQLLKACKNDLEIENIKDAMRHDGIALCNFFAWLEDSLENNERVSELDIAKMLSYFRAKNPLYISDSFATIAGFNANGAQPHYCASSNSFAYIESHGLLLIDSGGQYSNGTTDITRVVPIGKPSVEQVKDYTLVLKAHIALASASFPIDIPMPFLDSICRAILWNNQINYFHGTGHGVGYFLNVHEGPQVISCSANALLKTQAKIGMLSSIEPGIYRAGKWGIRLENLVVNTMVSNPKENEFGEFLCFDVLTLCPFETSCIDTLLLNQDEKKWLNDYHKKVRQNLESSLQGRSREWLLQRTNDII